MLALATPDARLAELAGVLAAWDHDRAHGADGERSSFTIEAFAIGLGGTAEEQIGLSGTRGLRGPGG